MQILNLHYILESAVKCEIYLISEHRSKSKQSYSVRFKKRKMTMIINS
jgi:hypothetical protein